MRRAIFLDRDGVINRAIVRDGKPYPPANLTQMEILPGVPSALTALHNAGFMLIVVTNQPDVARGTTSREVVEEINQYLAQCLPIDEFRTCFHDTGDDCDCRKPRPGALFAAAQLHDIDLKTSYMIGDRWRDTEAGQRAGCKTIFIDYGYDEKQPESVDFCVRSLTDAAQVILGETA
ncbi:D-glycero-alpha-D-manno-heptose-1,7-bisphosphate 7-phosphatase [Pollutimonas bauzanensis]|uniref:D,D-heptose 1,7-bisphosphate phosphatase n=1 Tax=Pollutimonas bauzanensis TaxID=658167 RepID=A0A1M5ZTP2_9BURK|nr:HAD family hydrolase [Pollutimonas bauzanensis]SHI27675.1 D-alpha,beta-D-heptose 1,7-bisphosphate phosphatase [Pollutimonas bauzanensis]